MKSNEKRCKICDSKINSYDFYVTSDENEFFCSNDCCKENFNKTGYQDYIRFSTCVGYYDCEKLNNIDDRCRTSNKINFSQFGSSSIDLLPNRCPPAEISIIRTNMKLYNFVKQSEEQSSKLNEETLNLTKYNVKLTKAMLFLAAINAICIIIQIFLQIW
ncbi:MAG: hypothetical protein IJI80_06605 [Methanobrevibacter sp.]|uniref:hypothetical protein n=1 Tax=Methanobrevibacter sp. TaxID=66852 RepID=UPI0025E95520|nr:hypothetical protein [Methanobrevibacter sp.]MBQ6139332.1 hypothetical protein [Methanobrevibacter sp.]